MVPVAVTTGNSAIGGGCSRQRRYLGAEEVLMVVDYRYVDRCLCLHVMRGHRQGEESGHSSGDAEAQRHRFCLFSSAKVDVAREAPQFDVRSAAVQRAGDGALDLEAKAAVPLPPDA
jgi:hypothetical protein